MPLRPTLDELKTLWLHAYARSSLHEAEEFAGVVAGTAAESSAHKAAVTASIIAYARPFTQSQVTSNFRTVPLAGVAPPEALAGAHGIFLNLRNKVVGHKDGTPAEGHTSTPNVVRIHRDLTGFNMHTNVVAAMGPDLRGELLQLCHHYVAHCEGVLTPLMAKYGPEICKKPPGSYELHVVAEPGDWIVIASTGEAQGSA